MESIKLELTKAVNEAAAYGSLKKGSEEFKGLVMTQNSEGIQVLLNGEPFAERKTTADDKPADWAIPKTDDAKVQDFYEKVDEMTTRLREGYILSNNIID